VGIENPVHLLFIAVVALLVLGPKRLPDLARAVGKGVREFRDAMSVGEAEQPSLPEPEPEPELEPEPLPAAAAVQPPAAESQAPGLPAPSGEPQAAPTVAPPGVPPAGPEV
jgi:TatA/E family protein of Tat protein translocase